MLNEEAAAPNDQINRLADELRAFLNEADLVTVDGPDRETLAVDYYGNTIYLSVRLGSIYLFLPLFDDAEAEQSERDAARAYLENRLPLPIEFDGMARYQDRPYRRTGLIMELLMPRRFSPALLADAMDLAAETIERLAAAHGGTEN